MELNRNHYFAIGLVILFVGIQLRYVESFTLNEPTSKFIATQLGDNPSAGKPASFFPAAGPTPRRTIVPPPWLGWVMLSFGSVLVLQSLAMARPGGEGG